MIARFMTCDRELLRQALGGDLEADSAAQLESHLTTCELCRDELARLAGGDEWLLEVRQHLSSAEVTPYQTGSGREARRVALGAAVIPADAPVDAEGPEDPAEALDFLEPSADPTKLGRLGGYEIERVIGRGGMGIVLKAFDTALNRYVAIKVLAAVLATSGAARRRFSRESQAAAAIAHEHVVAIHAVDNSGKLPFLVMPYIPGKSLQERLDEAGPLELTAVLRIGLQAASGLAAAHAQGLVHRDIKPANILLENGIERVRITDFGLARAVDDASQTQSGFIAGTPQYMAPEQARGEPVDHRADLFSLGSVMYAMCTGRPPFRAETTFAVLRRICEETPRPLRETNPEIPDWFQAIVSKLHARDPADRFQTAAEVAELLEQYLAHLQQPATCPAPRFQPTVTARWFREGGWARRMVGGLAVCVILLAGWSIFGGVLPVRDGLTPAGNRSPAAGLAVSHSGQIPAMATSSQGVAGLMSVRPAESRPTESRPTITRSTTWRDWDREVDGLLTELNSLERDLAKSLPPGAPIDQRAEISRVSQQLQAVEQELNSRSPAERLKPR